MGINWKVRSRNPLWWAHVLGTFLLTALAYNQMEATQLTNWRALWDVLLGIGRNPYLLVLCAWSVWSAINDPTVAGAGDSAQALSYQLPKKDGENDGAG